MDNLRKAKKLLFQHGKTYAAASIFFPKRIKHAVYTFYSFVRILDDYVDVGEKSFEDIQRYLLCKKQEVIQGRSSEEAIQDFIELIMEFHIPREYPLAFIDSMLMDISVFHYATYADLEKYMYGSAYVIGIIMAYLLGVDAVYFSYAGELGNAMQLTNFLRDIGEDLDRGRIYIPLSYLSLHGYSKQDLIERMYNDNFISLYQDLIEKTHGMYAYANEGITQIPGKRSQLAIRSASRLYEEILTKIEKENYHVFENRAHTSQLEKIWIMAQVAIINLV